MPLVVKTITAADAAFADCMRIRLDVFVGEQNVPLEEEQDELDATAMHFLAVDDGAPAGTARVVFKDEKTAKIGRVAVTRLHRGRGYGVALMKAIETELPWIETFLLDAQLQALRFYERLGYATASEIFMEAGIPHRRMTKTAPR